MVKLKSTIKAIYNRRFKQKAVCRLSRKGFTEPEFQQLLRHTISEKFRILFKYQATFGLQAGEVCRLNLCDIDFERMELRVFRLRSGKGPQERTRIPPALFEETYSFIESHAGQIAEAQGFIFFKDRDNTNNEPHISKDYLRNVFRLTIKKANLDSIYEYSNESAPSRKVRALHRLTTRSLCDYASSFGAGTSGVITKA